MKMRRLFRSAVSLAVLVCFLTLTVACYGSFNLTRQVYRWNGSARGDSPVATKWIIEGVFLLLIFLPIYGVAMLIDGLILNSIEFWTDRNPMGTSQTEDGKTKVVRVGDTTATVKFSDDGLSAEVTYARAGKVFKTARLIADGQQFRLVDAANHDLYTATIDSRGQVTVADENCALVASKNLTQHTFEVAGFRHRG